MSLWLPKGVHMQLRLFPIYVMLSQLIAIAVVYGS